MIRDCRKASIRFLYDEIELAYRFHGTALRIEWCRVCARAFHWAEELLLVQEEMRRVLETFQYQRNWWERQNGRRIGLSPEIMEGLSAYACKQASQRQALYCGEQKFCYRVYLNN